MMITNGQQSSFGLNEPMHPMPEHSVYLQLLQALVTCSTCQCDLKTSGENAEEKEEQVVPPP